MPTATRIAARIGRRRKVQLALSASWDARALGIDASYLHPAERRLFDGRNGVVADAVVSIVLGVISSAAWDGLKRWFSTSLNPSEGFGPS